MKKLTFIVGIALTVMLLGANPLTAQPFWGYQTIGVHTFYFSVQCQDDIKLGIGYNARFGGRPFTDYTFEWQVPLQEVFRPQSQQLIAGVYRPINLTSRPFMGVGAHLRLDQNKQDDVKSSRISLAVTGMPSYTYAASLGDGPYGTVGARLTYKLMLAQRMQLGTEAPTWQGLPAHGVELGGHLDFHIERTLGLATNIYTSRLWALKEDALSEEEKDWELIGNGSIGMTYHLGRW